MKTKNKLLLAALAAIAILLDPASARAGTGWARGGNWADVNANVTGIHFWTGITTATTPAEATNVTDQVVKDFSSVGINFVRVAVNPATVSSSYWPIFQDCINEMVAKGMNVDIGCWYCWPLDNHGVITNMTDWENMWKTVDATYKNNSSVYYEPINEPAGYSLTGLEGVYTTFLGFIQKSQDHILLDGTGFAGDVTGIGGDSAFNSCLLSLHIYAGWGGCTDEASYENYLANTVVKSYHDRTIITEMGCTTTNGFNFTKSDNSNNQISLIRGVAIQCRAWGMGFMYWPANIPIAGNGLQNGTTLYHTVGGAIINHSMISELNYGWNNTGSTNARADFIGDGMDDYVYFHTNNATWYITYAGGLATNSFQWGATGDIPLVDGDWDGSGIASAVVWRPSNATWYIRSGIDGNELGPIQWGATGDIPLLGGDCDGDGVPDPVVWRPSNTTWYIYSTKNNGELKSFSWGQAGDIPLMNGDFDHDGVADAVIFRPSNNTWYIWSVGKNSEIGSYQFGTSGCVPVLGGDYDGDGIPDLQYFDPSTGTWHIRFSHDASTRTVTWGLSGDIPWGGYSTSDKVVDEIVYRPSSGSFYVRDSSSGGNFNVPTTGTTNDIPVH